MDMTPSELSEVERKFERLHKIALKSKFYRATENRYVEEFNIDIKSISKKLYIVSQSYETLSILTYEHILEYVSLIIRDKRILENFFNIPIRIQESLLKEGHKLGSTDSLWSFMIVLEAANYPNLFFLKADFINLDEMLEKVNEKRSDKIEAKSVDSKFRYSAAVCSKKYRENYQGHRIYQGVGITYFFLLAVTFGFDLMKEILDSLVKEETLPTFANLFELAKNWNEIKDYPLDWAIEIT